jgi:hypothetical protein
MVFGLAVVNANLKVFIISSDHSIASLFFNSGSMGAYLATVFLIDSMFRTSNIYKTIN